MLQRLSENNNILVRIYAVVKVVLWSRGAHYLTKPGWSKPHTHSNPTNLALFRHKITLYRFNQGAHTIAGGGAQIVAGGWAPEPPPQFNHWIYVYQRSAFSPQIRKILRICVRKRTGPQSTHLFNWLWLRRPGIAAGRPSVRVRRTAASARWLQNTASRARQRFSNNLSFQIPFGRTPSGCRFSAVLGGSIITLTLIDLRFVWQITSNGWSDFNSDC